MLIKLCVWPNSHSLSKLYLSVICCGEHFVLCRLKIGTTTSAYHVTKACRMKLYIDRFIWSFVITENIQLLLQMSHDKSHAPPPAQEQHKCVHIALANTAEVKRSTPPCCSVNAYQPNTVKTHFLTLKRLILAFRWINSSLIINRDTHNHLKTVALNKWHVFCVIILRILTNTTH